MPAMQSGTQVLVDASHRPQLRRLRLEVRRGQDKGKSFELDEDPIRIGTSAGCQVVLRDPTVSGVHTELARTRHGLLIRDLGSTNGTFVDGRRVQAVYADGVVALLVGGTELKLTPLKETAPVELSADDRFGELVGASVAMRATFAKLKRVADTETTVLLTGETGTG
ncbi:MAG: FHA domain-containing protein, partial [Deltaproteobacteria bacterium]|nr:FHA domain-containing protein [Deltaproteobacteria bacterium]